MKSKDIIVIFNTKGVTLDVQETSGKFYYNEKLLSDYKSDPYSALFFFGFEDRDPDMSVSLLFLYDICRRFISGLSTDPDIEITKAVRDPDPAMIYEMLMGAPYALGSENINIS